MTEILNSKLERNQNTFLKLDYLDLGFVGDLDIGI
jgi:hypothetical protein